MTDKKKKPDQYTVLFNSIAFKQLRERVGKKIKGMETASLQLLADDNDALAKEEAKQAKHWRECMKYIETTLLNSME